MLYYKNSEKQFTFVLNVECIRTMLNKILKLGLIFLLIFNVHKAAAQKKENSPDSSKYFFTGKPLSNKDSLKFYERRLISLSESIITAREMSQRYTSTYHFARTLISALKLPNSFNYPFDSVKKYISILTSPDKKFRIFTWSLKWGKDSLVTADSFEFYGAIQMNNKEKLELYGLYDNSTKVGKAEYTQLSNRSWYGALYYQMAEVKYKRKKYYTLLGWDGHTMASSRKVIDVITFDEMGKPVFGAPIFDMSDKKPPKYRIVFEFRDDAVMTVRHIPKKKLIAFENLIPPSPNAVGLYERYLPDGSYDYFIFKKGKWIKKKLLFENVKRIPSDAFAPLGQQ